MPDSTDYSAVRTADGSYSLISNAPPNAGAAIAHIRPMRNHHRAISGWKLVPLVVMRGSRCRIWPSAADAIAATRLMTVARARRILAQADAAEGDAP